MRPRDWDKAVRALRHAYRVYEPTRSRRIKQAIVEAGRICAAEAKKPDPQRELFKEAY